MLGYPIGTTAVGGAYKSLTAVTPPPTSTVVSVVVTPSAATIAAGATLQLSAVVLGLNSPLQAVTWSAPDSEVDADGLFTAPAEPFIQTIKVRATSDQDPEVWGEATITVAALPVGGPSNYIRGKLATHAGALHLNLATVHWSLQSQLLPSEFGKPVAKGVHVMTAGSAELQIAVPAAVVPAGWYMLAMSDPDGTTTVLSRILVGP